MCITRKLNKLAQKKYKIQMFWIYSLSLFFSVYLKQEIRRNFSAPSNEETEQHAIERLSKVFVEELCPV